MLYPPSKKTMLYLHNYKISYRALARTWLVPESQSQAALLRGAIFHALTRQCCPYDRSQLKEGQDCAGCNCLRRLFFEPPFPAGYPHAAKYAPHVAPYVILSNARHGFWNPGETWEWQLTVVGRTNELMPQLLEALRFAAPLTGEVPGAWELLRVEEYNPLNLQAEDGSIARNSWTAEQPAADFKPRFPLSHTDVQAAQQPLELLRIHLLTPLELYQKKEKIWQPKPYFFLQRLYERISLLGQLFCDAPWDQQLEVPDLAKEWQADFELDTTSWRKSITGRQSLPNLHQDFTVTGIQGSITWRGEGLHSVLPLLFIGQYLHLGKKTVFGQGLYVVEVGS